MTDAQNPGQKSLTPHRKHHKLLKDGSEVWSEEVERIFVQGNHPPENFSRPAARSFFVRILRSARVLGVSVGHLLPWTQQMAQPVPRRAPQEGRH